jgi:hypothetical protein
MCNWKATMLIGLDNFDIRKQAEEIANKILSGKESQESQNYVSKK